jgi:predicted AAA+ superfamily ATPase
MFKPPQSSYFLLGPRGTGKSLFLREKYRGSTYVNLLDENLYQSYLADVGLFYQQLVGLNRGETVVVDEVQRLPHLLNEVHRLIEENGLRFVLSGSSARKLRRSGVNLLAGRALNCYMHPFTPEELGDDFSLDEALKNGTIPLCFSSPHPTATLKAYTQTYLKEEIQNEAIVRNLPGFARFLPVAALYHGQVLNIASAARDAEVSRTTIEGYFGILEDTLIGFKWPAYESGIRVREKKKPKFYFVDPGLVRALKRSSGEVSPEERGHLFEGFIAQILRAYRDYRDLYDEHFYWAPAEANKTEVDFLLTRGKNLIAIECKSSQRVAKTDLMGLNAVKEMNSVERRILVFLGERKRTVDGIEILPLRDFLDLLEEDRL